MKKLCGVLICFFLLTFISSARIIEVADAGITDKLKAVIAAKNAAGGADVTAPTVDTVVIGTDGTTVTLTMSENTTVANQDDDEFNLDCDGASGANVAMAYSSGTGTTSLVFTTGATEIQSTETCNLDYSNAQADEFEDAAGNDLSSPITDKAVTNNSEQGGGGSDTIGPLQVAADTDDCMDDNGGDAEYCTGAFSRNFGNQRYYMAFRWDNITLEGSAGGRTVTSCTLEIRGAEAYTAPITWELHGVDEDDPPTFGSAQSPGNTTEVPQTTAYENFTEYPNVADFVSFDCTDAVQELINTYEFNGTALALVAEYQSGADYTTVSLYEVDSGHGAKLTFGYDYE